MNGKRPLCFFCLAIVSAIILCVWIIPLSVPDYSKWDGQQLSLEGKIYQKEYKQIYGQDILILYLKTVQVLDNSFNFPQNQTENIICYMEERQEPPIGCRVRVKGKLRSFRPATNPGEFDMAKYYRIMKLDFKLEKAHITAYGETYSVLKENLYQIKKYFAKILERCFDEKNASILKAMLLGEKNSLLKETKEIYQESGIIHILAISGLHISIIGMGLYKLLRRCFMPIWTAAAASAVFICCYGIMTGMSSSAVRAIFMFLLQLIAKVVGRTYDLLTALCLAAVLLLIEQPLYVMHSGFLFSFTAVLSLALLSPVLYERSRAKAPKESTFLIKMKQAAASGIAVMIATLPIHLIFYFQFPIYSFFLNLLIIPLMTIVMYDGLFCMLLGGILPFIAQKAGYIDRFILWFYEKSCLLAGKIPYGTFIGGKPEMWQIIVYIIMLITLAVINKKVTGIWKWQWIILCIMILTFRRTDGLRITIIDVGQGDSIYIQSDEGNHYLIDGGSSSKSKTGEYQIIPFLKSQGVSSLSAVFVTHADSDHTNGIASLLEQSGNGGIQVDCLVLPDVNKKSKTDSYIELVLLAKQKEIPVAYMSRGQYIKDGEMLLTCMHPSNNYLTEDANEYSLVLALHYRMFSALFTGDVEGRGEELMKNIIKTTKNKFTLLKVAHHGSRNSTDKEFLNMIEPQMSVISCGEKNSYGHPHKELLGRLKAADSKVYITKEKGAVTIHTDGNTVEMSSFK